MTAAVTTERSLPGRTRIADRALRRIVSAVTADALAVRASQVSVDIDDTGRALAIEARAPIRIRPLDGSPGSDRSLVERLTAAQAVIRDRSRALTGAEVGRVDLRITSADLPERRRVR